MKAPRSLVLVFASTYCATASLITSSNDTAKRALTPHTLSFVSTSVLDTFKTTSDEYPPRYSPKFVLSQAQSTHRSLNFMYKERGEPDLSYLTVKNNLAFDLDYTIYPRIIDTDKGMKFFLEEGKQLEFNLKSNHVSTTSRPTSNPPTLKATAPSNKFIFEIAVDSNDEVQCTRQYYHTMFSRSFTTKYCTCPEFVTADGLRNGNDYAIQLWDDKTVVVIKKMINEDGRLVGQFFSDEERRWFDLPTLKFDEGTAESVASVYSTNLLRFSDGVSLVLSIKAKRSSAAGTGISGVYYYKRSLRLKKSEKKGRLVMESEWQGTEERKGVMAFDHAEYKFRDISFDRRRL